MEKKLRKLSDEQLHALEKATIRKKIDSAHEQARQAVAEAPRSIAAMQKYLEGDHDGKSEATRALAGDLNLNAKLKRMQLEKRRRTKQRERQLMRLAPAELQIRAAERLAHELRQMETRIDAGHRDQSTSKRQASLKPKLDEKGWSVSDWAEQSGVDHHTASDYLNGKTKPFASTRKKLAESLGIQVEELPQ